ncbi:MAG TPA: hypothetical protein VFL82_03450 [Thermomicrobiales bacterium]|nr:hypothetical protein [Thermomicrobiales bacterium]
MTANGITVGLLLLPEERNHLARLLAADDAGERPDFLPRGKGR